jgi:hypothetical protein
VSTHATGAGAAMKQQSDGQLVIVEGLRRLGYASERCIRLYGAEFHLASDPVPVADGFAIEGIDRTSGRSRSIRIPLSLLHMVRRQPIFDGHSDIVA